ncbi:LysR family transcriptional regulator [Alteromonas lipolytica]|uniref:LysR family transcriptional regulator n=1 Tax=Alteromonas lipolytica TaxID=1856405 RepID=A0A1E8FA55_9ALTE|nr:LysR family transcriptional regulator [Alteromonas lipolytica]OFI32804.1 LysR family transcriptional regulator [Alteromonas lipolytica]GGF72848.1 LysR family transcriptional regulator [Alteromonas lipolytica]
MDKVTAAKVFIDVAHSGSFTATAERLEMSRPMVTRYIEALEDWLQVRLLHRTTRKISLTSKGAQCLPEIEKWISQADELISITGSKDKLTGTIRLATSTSFGFAKLSGALASFLKHHPLISIDVDLQDGTSDLVERQLDLAIRITANPDPSLVGKPIGVCESILVASEAYIKSSSMIKEPADLSRHQCLGYKQFDQHTWYLNNGAEQKAVNIECRFTANETTNLLHATLHGAGVALLPTYLTESYIQSGELKHILPLWKPHDLQIYALYSSRKHLRPAVRQLIDYLESYLNA